MRQFDTSFATVAETEAAALLCTLADIAADYVSADASAILRVFARDLAQHRDTAAAVRLRDAAGVLLAVDDITPRGLAVGTLRDGAERFVDGTLSLALARELADQGREEAAVLCLADAVAEFEGAGAVPWCTVERTAA